MISIIKAKKESMEEEILNPPEGWILPKDAQSMLSNHPFERRKSVAYNLPLVALRAEQLIDGLMDSLSIRVPVSYLRIDEGTSFHILLLVDRPDYLSPKINAARILAEQYIHKDDQFDIHFIFSVRSENIFVDPIAIQGYTLMHIREDQKDAA